MNELGGVGEKDLHQCEEEFLPQKSIEAGSFILFFVYPRSLGECFIADPTLIPKFDDGEGVDQGRGIVRVQAIRIDPTVNIINSTILLVLYFPSRPILMKVWWLSDLL